MNSLLRSLRNSNCSIKFIHHLEHALKAKWNHYSPDRPYEYLAYNEAFAELLLAIDEGKVTNAFDLRKVFRKIYNSKFNAIQKRTSVIPKESMDEVKISVPRLDLSGLTSCDILILYQYMKNKKKDKKVANIISKLRFRSELNDSIVSELMNGANIATLYLIDKMGVRGFIEFTNLMNQMGVYYPITNIPDEEFIIELKTRLIDKFIDSINMTTSEDAISHLEKLIFN